MVGALEWLKRLGVSRDLGSKKSIIFSIHACFENYPSTPFTHYEALLLITKAW